MKLINPHKIRFWFLFTAVFVLLLRLFAGTYYDASDDCMINFLLRGVGGGEVISVYPRFYFGFGKLLAWLYSVAPSIPWQALVFMMLQVLSVAAILTTINQNLQKFGWARFIISTLILLLVFAEPFMFLNLNRVSSLLFLGGVVALLYLWEGISYKYLSIAVFLMVCGMMIRPNGGVLVLVFILPCVFYFFGKKLLSRLNLYRIGVFVVVFGVLCGFLNMSFNPKVKEMKQRNYLKSNVVDFSYINTHVLKNKADSLRFEAIAGWYVNDKNADIAFMKKLTDDNRVPLEKQSVGRYVQSTKLLAKKLTWDYAWFSFIVALWLLTKFGARNKFLKAFALIVFQLLLIILLGGMFKMPDKILGPALIIIVTPILYEVMAYIQEKKIHLSISILVFLFVGLYTVKLIHRVQLTSAIQERKEKMLSFVENNANGNKIVTGKYNYILNYLDPWKVYPMNFGKRFVNITGWINLLPGYEKQYQAIAGVNDLEGLLKKATNQKEFQFVFYEKGMVVFIEEYFMYFYDLDIKFKQINKDSERLGIFWYQLQSN